MVGVAGSIPTAPIVCSAVCLRVRVAARVTKPFWGYIISVGKDQKYRRNDEIRVPEVRVIGEDGEQLGVMNTRQALLSASEQGLDLIEISPAATPPVCKLVDFGKFQYEVKKKQQEAKKKQTVIQVKEVKFRPITEDHDFKFKLKHIERFITDGDKAKITVRFKGREITHPEGGHEMCARIIQELGELVQVEQPPKLEGRQLIMVLVPKKK